MEFAKRTELRIRRLANVYNISRKVRKENESLGERKGFPARRGDVSITGGRQPPGERVNQ